VLDKDSIEISNKEIKIVGHTLPISLKLTNSYEDMCD